MKLDPALDRIAWRAWCRRRYPKMTDRQCDDLFTELMQQRAARKRRHNRGPT